MALVHNSFLYLYGMTKKVFLFLFACIAFMSCQQNSQSNQKIFRINQATGIESLDPAFAKSLWMMWHANQLFNRLVENDADLKIKPSLAKSWEISEDRLHYTFHLRTDVFFQENDAFANGIGRKMTAQDVVYSFDRIIDEATNSPGAWIFNDKVDSIKPFEALDDSTFQINLLAPYNPMLNVLSMMYASIVPQEVVKKWGKDFRSHPCGTGPFMLEYWDEGNVVVHKKNNHYWEKDSAGNMLPYLHAIKCTFIDSKASEFLMFMQGKLDFMNGLDASFKDQLLTKKGNLKDAYIGKMKLNKKAYLNIEYLGILLDNSKPNAYSLLQNVNVRNAINKGFDKQKLVAYLRNNVGVPAQNGMIPNGLLGFDSNQQKISLYDVAAAKQLLKGIDTKEQLKLYVPDMYEDRCSFIASQLLELGIHVKIEIIQQGMLREKISQSTAGLFWATWIADYADAESYLSMFYSKNTAPPNYTRFKNEAFDKLYDASLKEQNEAEKEKQYKAMDKIIREQAPAIPLFYDEVLHFLKPNVQGWESNGLNLISLKKVSKQ
jgi:peptide/nickel transport system substrate-binding protein